MGRGTADTQGTHVRDEDAQKIKMRANAIIGEVPHLVVLTKFA